MQKWVDEEFLERIHSSGTINPGIAWHLRPEVWEPIFSKDAKSRGDRRFDYTYNERFFEGNQLMRLINALQEDINSRRCVLQVYQWDKDIRGLEKLERVPCSVDYSWLYRDNQLNIFYHMRSCDFYEHFINDMNLAGKLNWWVASQVGVKAGSLIVYINSLHAYKKDLDERKIF
jgi:thymidylate synthase